MISKKEANFRHAGYVHKRCATCTMFVVPDRCTLVRGFIGPMAVCDYWEDEEGGLEEEQAR